MTRPIPSHITVKDVGGILIFAKANSLSKQLAALADHARLGICPVQDICPKSAGYNPRASFKAVM